MKLDRAIMRRSLSNSTVPSCMEGKAEEGGDSLSKTYKQYKQLNLEPPFVATFVAPRKSGKTHLITQLLLEVWKDMFDYIIIASPSLEYENEYEIEDEVPDRSRLLKVSKNIGEIMTQIISDQKNAAILHKENKDEYELPSTLIILDDIIDSGLMKWGSNKNVVDEIAERGRHYGMSVVLTSQYMSAVSPSIRRNAEALFLFAPINFADVDRTLEEYVPKRWRKEFLERVEEVFSERFAFIIIDGSVARRLDFRLRLRKGFTDTVLPIEQKVPAKEEIISAKRTKRRKRRHSESADE